MEINKQCLIDVCVDIVEAKLNNVQRAINGYQEDLNSETKSSAGDKHETGRAMLQLEMEKLGQQYQTILSQKNTLQKIDINPKEKAQLGSLLEVKGLYYFMATSIGQVKLEDKTIMVLSINSPIGKLLLGKQKGDSFLFNEKKMEVKSVD